MAEESVSENREKYKVNLEILSFFFFWKCFLKVRVVMHLEFSKIINHRNYDNNWMSQIILIAPFRTQKR